MYFSKAVTSTPSGGGGYPQKDPGIRGFWAKVCGIRVPGPDAGGRMFAA